jgi:hypothetical protein
MQALVGLRAPLNLLRLLPAFARLERRGRGAARHPPRNVPSVSRARLVAAGRIRNRARSLRGRGRELRGDGRTRASGGCGVGTRQGPRAEQRGAGAGTSVSDPRLLPGRFVREEVGRGRRNVELCAGAHGDGGRHEWIPQLPAAVARRERLRVGVVRLPTAGPAHRACTCVRVGGGGLRRGRGGRSEREELAVPHLRPSPLARPRRGVGAPGSLGAQPAMIGRFGFLRPCLRRSSPRFRFVRARVRDDGGLGWAGGRHIIRQRRAGRERSAGFCGRQLPDNALARLTGAPAARPAARFAKHGGLRSCLSRRPRGGGFLFLSRRRFLVSAGRGRGQTRVRLACSRAALRGRGRGRRRRRRHAGSTGSDVGGKGLRRGRRGEGRGRRGNEHLAGARADLELGSGGGMELAEREQSVCVYMCVQASDVCPAARAQIYVNLPQVPEGRTTGACTHMKIRTNTRTRIHTYIHIQTHTNTHAGTVCPVQRDTLMVANAREVPGRVGRQRKQRRRCAGLPRATVRACAAHRSLRCGRAPRRSGSLAFARRATRLRLVRPGRTRGAGLRRGRAPAEANVVAASRTLASRFRSLRARRTQSRAAAIAGESGRGEAARTRGVGRAGVDPGGGAAWGHTRKRK